MRSGLQGMRVLAAALLGYSALSTAALANDDTATFDATATTQAAISVTCGADLRFGTIGVHPDNGPATINVAASSGAEATSTSAEDAYPAGTDSGPGECTVSNETGGDAAAELSAATGTWSAPTLSGVELSFEANTLEADITLSKASAIGNETIFVGGALSIPANHTAFGNYTQTITITVTD